MARRRVDNNVKPKRTVNRNYCELASPIYRQIVNELPKGEHRTQLLNEFKNRTK